MLRQQLKEKSFVVTMEVDPPRGADPWPVFTAIHDLADRLTAVNIADSPTAKLRMSPIALAYLVQDRLNLESIFHLTCRDRNLLGLQAELLGAYALGVRNILTLTGDDPKLGDHPDATGIFDVNSKGLAKMAAQLNQGKDYHGHDLDNATDFFVGAVANPVMEDLQKEAARVREKIEHGVQFFQTQPVYTLEQVERFADAVQTDVPFIYGIMPVKSVKQAHYLNNNVPGVHVPDEMIAILERDGAAGGMEYLCRLVQQLKPHVAGIHIFPMRQYHLAEQLIEVL
ncbi:MAG: methylenetetrahydrofolate reductase [Peptococcaceae bacterium]